MAWQTDCSRETNFTLQKYFSKKDFGHSTSTKYIDQLGRQAIVAAAINQGLLACLGGFER